MTARCKCAGPIHFVSYSTEESVAVGSPQYNFLAADLAAVNRTITPWVVASGHRPVSCYYPLWPTRKQIGVFSLSEYTHPGSIKFLSVMTMSCHSSRLERHCRGEVHGGIFESMGQ